MNWPIVGAHLSFHRSRAQFPKYLQSHRMRTCGALALRSPSYGYSLAHGRRRPAERPRPEPPL
eukprot:6208887-Pleurochrysis_carterae.AAC.1